MDNTTLDPAENIIYNQNAKNISRMADNSVDLVFTDPPYNARKDYGEYSDDLPMDEYIDFMKWMIGECKRISKRGIGIYTDSMRLRLFWQKIVPDASIIVIHKRASGVSKNELNIVQHHHAILTTAESLNHYTRSLWDDIRVYGEGYFYREETFGHPAQTSLKATKRYISHFSDRGEIILDPFMGVGTTAVACKSLGRVYAGFELNKEYIRIANDGLSDVKRSRTIHDFF